MHLRRKILETIRTQLKNTNAFAGVWIQRALPQRVGYPAVTLYADEEQVETLQIHDPPRDQDRILTVTVVVWTRGTPDDERSEEFMDGSAVIVESAVKKPAEADNLRLLSTDFQIDDEEAEIHSIIFTYIVGYTSSEFSPTV